MNVCLFLTSEFQGRNIRHEAHNSGRARAGVEFLFYTTNNSQLQTHPSRGTRTLGALHRRYVFTLCRIRIRRDFKILNQYGRPN